MARGSFARRLAAFRFFPASLSVLPVMLAVAFIGTAAPGAAQEPGRIVGTVTDAASGAPIPEAQVFIPASSLGGLTRANGGFVILGVAAGTHGLRTERIGYGPVEQQVTVAAGQTVQLNIQMSAQALGLDEIVV